MFIWTEADEWIYWGMNKKEIDKKYYNKWTRTNGAKLF